jgi:hypothetical protein
MLEFPSILEIPLRADDWRYKNEGALHIILEFCGDSSLSQHENLVSDR